MIIILSLYLHAKKRLTQLLLFVCLHLKPFLSQKKMIRKFNLQTKPKIKSQPKSLFDRKPDKIWIIRNWDLNSITKESALSLYVTQSALFLSSIICEFPKYLLLQSSHFVHKEKLYRNVFLKKMLKSPNRKNMLNFYLSFFRCLNG